MSTTHQNPEKNSQSADHPNNPTTNEEILALLRQLVNEKPRMKRMGRLAGLAHRRDHNAPQGIQRLLRRYDQIEDEAWHLDCALHPPCTTYSFERP